MINPLSRLGFRPQDCKNTNGFSGVMTQAFNQSIPDAEAGRFR